MAIVLPGRQHKPNFYEGLIGGLAQSAPQALENYQARQEQQRREALLAEQSAKKAAQEERMKQLELKSKEKIPFLKEEAKGQRQEEVYNKIVNGGRNVKNENAVDEQIQNNRPFHERITPEEELALSVVNPQAANTISKQREFAQKQKQHEEKIKTDIHKESVEYDRDTRKKAETAKKQLEAVSDIRESIKEGKTGSGGISRFFKGFGTIGDKISDFFKTAEQGKFEANTPLLLEGWKDVFGVRLSDSDLKVLLDKLPSISKSPEANEAVLKVIEKYARPLILKDEIAREVKKENGGYRPINFEDMVNERLDKRLEDERGVRVRNKTTRKIVRIPKGQVEAALQNGGELVNE